MSINCCEESGRKKVEHFNNKMKIDVVTKRLNKMKNELKERLK